MSQPTAKEVSAKPVPPCVDGRVLTIDGVELTLRYDLEALGRIEVGMGGVPYQTLLGQIQQTNSVGVQQLKLLLWAGVEENDRTVEGAGILSPEHAGAWINRAAGETLQEKLMCVQEVVFQSFLSVMLRGKSLQAANEACANQFAAARAGLRNISAETLREAEEE